MAGVEIYPPPEPVVLPGDYTVDTLPDPTAFVDRYARVTDLFGSKRDLVLASAVGAQAFWQPVRANFAKTLPADAAYNLIPLKSPSAILLTGAMSANRNVALSTVGAWPGAEFNVGFDGTLGLFGLNVTGLASNSVLALLTGARKRFIFDGSAWQTF